MQATVHAQLGWTHGCGDERSDRRSIVATTNRVRDQFAFYPGDGSGRATCARAAKSAVLGLGWRNDGPLDPRRDLIHSSVVSRNVSKAVGHNAVGPIMAQHHDKARLFILGVRFLLRIFG